MTDEADVYRLITFDSNDAPPALRFELWRDLMKRKLLRVAMDKIADGPHRVDARLRRLPQLRVGYGVCSPAVHHRTRGVTSDENEDFLLIVSLEGPFVAKGRSGDTTVGAGEAFLIKCHEAGTYVTTGVNRSLTVRISPGALGTFAPLAERSAGVLVPAANEGLRLLTPYATALTTGEMYYSPAAGQMVTEHVGDLLALILGATGDEAELARGRELAASRLAAAKAYARERLGQADLSEPDAAAHQGVSPRHLRRLFAQQGESFSNYVRELRLHQAHAMLTSRRFSAHTVSAIAYDVGFGDLSYFNRAFRLRFDRTPREARAEASRGRDGDAGG